MPIIHYSSVKICRLSRLFTSIYSVLYNRFTTHIIWILSWYSHLNTIFSLKQLMFYYKSTQNGSKIYFIGYCCLQLLDFAQNHPKHTLQNQQYSKKHLKYTLKAFKSSLIIQKSTQKRSKAFKKYSTSPLFSIIPMLFTAFFNVVKVQSIIVYNTKHFAYGI